MDNIKQTPTPQMILLSCLDDADNIQEAIDLDQKYINKSLNQRPIRFAFINEETEEATHYVLGKPDHELIKIMRERIKKNQARIKQIREFIAELVLENPELAPDELRSFDIWSEGYQASGDSGDATYFGTYNAATFDDAVRQYISSHPEDEYLFRHSETGWSYWGCKLYDNEAQARLSFG